MLLKTLQKQKGDYSDAASFVKNSDDFIGINQKFLCYEVMEHEAIMLNGIEVPR